MEYRLQKTRARPLNKVAKGRLRYLANSIFFIQKECPVRIGNLGSYKHIALIDFRS